MKIAWVLTTVSAVVCTTASMVLFGQYTLLTKLSADEVEQWVKYQNFDASFNEGQFIRNTLQNQLEQQQKTVKDLEGEREKATVGERQKGAELDFCKTDKKKNDEELEVKQKEQAAAEANMSKESKVWEEEIASLNRVKEQPSKICAYIKDNTVGAKLCTTPAATGPQASGPAASGPAAAGSAAAA